MLLIRHLWLLLLLSLSSISCAFAQNTDWEIYKTRFVSEDGRVIDTFNKISHSEGQGWGMLFAEANNDRATFDRIWRWTRKNLSRPDVFLFSWRYDPLQKPPVKDPNNASDGDVLIAWALFKAAKRWNESNYETASAAIRADIVKHLVRDYAGYTVLLPGMSGFSEQESLDLNLSYWVIPAFIAFAIKEPEQPWSKLIVDGQRLLAGSRFGQHALPTDWIRLSENGQLSPSKDWPSRFGYDAVRIPLYFIWGSALTTELKQPFSEFWKRGEMILPWVDVLSGKTANYQASAGIQAVRALVYNDSAFLQKQPQMTDDYYSTSLLLLSKLAASPQ